MANNVDSGVLKILRPFLLFQKYLGFVSFEFKNGNRLEFSRKCRLHYIFSTFIHTLVIGRCIVLSVQFLGNYLNTVSLFEQMLNVSGFICKNVYILINCLSSRIYIRKILKMFNELLEIERELETMGIKIKHWSHKMLFIFVVDVIFFIIYLLMEFYMEYSLSDELLKTVSKIIFPFYLDISLVVSVINFATITVLLRDTLNALNDHLKVVFHQQKAVGPVFRSMESILTVKNLKTIHQGTLHFFRSYMATLSLGILFMTAVIFNWITLSIFNVITAVAELGLAPERNFPMDFFSCMAVLFIAQLGCLIVTAEMSYKEVATMKNVLFKVFTETTDEELRKEINAFSLQMLHENYEITAAGFFVIDSKLFVTILAAISMYTTVLIQFNPNAGVFQNYMHDHVL